MVNLVRQDYLEWLSHFDAVAKRFTEKLREFEATLFQKLADKNLSRIAYLFCGKGVKVFESLPIQIDCIDLGI